MKTTEERMKIFTYEEAISALKIYRDLTKQVLPALQNKDRQTVLEYNNDISEKLKKIDA